MKGPKILIINPFGIGDVIFSTPLIDALKKVYPDSFLGYVCNKRAFEVIKSHPALDKIIIFEKDDFRAALQESKTGLIKKVWDLLMSVRRERFDIAIDLSLGNQYSLFLMLIGVRKRFGLNYRNRGKFLTRKIDIDGFSDKHVIEYYLDVLRLLKIDPAPYHVRPSLYPAERASLWAENFLKENGVSINDLIVGVIPGCGASWGQDAKYRRWDKAKFARVCDGLIERYGAKVVLFGDSKELEICEEIKKMMKHEPVIACGKASLSDSLGLMERCRLVLTNDGGPLHMAVSLGIKTVSIFGPVDERVYGPYPMDSNHFVVSKNDIPCRPCYKKFKYNRCDNRICLESISVEDVEKGIDALLGGIKDERYVNIPGDR